MEVEEVGVYIGIRAVHHDECAHYYWTAFDWDYEDTDHYETAEEAMFAGQNTVHAWVEQMFEGA